MRTFLALLLLALPAAAQTDYFPSGDPVMPNGMDLDRDFVFGEDGVDDLACDGAGETETSNIATENLDGAIDAALERQIYVNLDTGTDNTTCGTTSSPCATINYAGTTRGPATTGSGDNLFICVQGTTSSIDFDDTDFDGATTATVSRTAASRSGSSNQRYDHVYPQNPTVIMGWDTDGDNQYPPFDADDTFLVNGGGNHLACSVTTCPSYLEIAHFSSDNAGQTSSTGGGFLSLGSGTPSAGRGNVWYVHDFDATDINGQQCQHSGNVAFSFQSWLDDAHFVRGNMTVGGGYVWRGNSTAVGVTYENLYIGLYAIGGASTNTDNNGSDCTGAGGGDPTGLQVFRTWTNSTATDNNEEYIDNTFYVDRSVGTDGYINGLTTNSDITMGIILGGWRHWNFSGNLVLDVFDATPDAHFNDGINVNQSSEDHYRINNTWRLTHTGAVATGTISPMLAKLSQGSGTGSSLTRDKMAGEYFIKDNCMDGGAQSTATYNSWVLMEGSSTWDFDEADLQVTGNNATGYWDASGRSVFHIAPNGSCTTCVPLNFLWADNLFRNEDGASTTQDMVKSVGPAWASSWDANSGNNQYWSDDFWDANTEYTTLAAWDAVTGIVETGSTAGTNPTHPGCFSLADGVDYSAAAGGGGGGGGGGATGFFRLIQSSP